MRPIPKRLLCHTAQLLNVTRSEWGAETETQVCTLQNVRLEAKHQLVTEGGNSTLKNIGTLFIDRTNSVPQGVTPETGQIVRMGGRRYRVETVRPVYAMNELHHWEAGLIGC